MHIGELIVYVILIVLAGILGGLVEIATYKGLVYLGAL